MKGKIQKGVVAILVLITVLVLDQILKVWVKTNMALYDTIEITKWFKIYFVENNGMAFGIEAIGKLFLSVFRIIAVGFISVYLIKIIRKEYKLGFIICVSMVLAGAFGNIIDSVFYGELFSASYPGHVAHFVPIGEGYASWLHGKVVDMLYFPIIETTLPNWVPFWGGTEILFFRFIFNLADASISVGVVLLLLFYRKTLSHSLQSDAERQKTILKNQETK
ncbi:MAG: lipoprotein signal peptidase [Dysgonamonadaceae bacterium]|jgi:signal peptidase II|nr:lipoprotein signal peptidase [Dysgonamonadaceae bacterium]MDD3355653.1 lipoprotein signal peptidase [Dysgonamonadaceae bacterium]MDD3727730.1 lipoprotein signal peptidase [Dysgonamonadaceae bacterium]MDD4246271.1 lipoprotein signal peptidase [Dysgonamonadaceae bacterium]MDD4605078.1 lipoprotein signal peptidase [Dysgonamonadaceae bacterium]